MKSLLFLIILAVFLPIVMAKVALSTKEQVWSADFQYLTRFAFEKDAGSMAIDILSTTGSQKLLLYGSEESWTAVYYSETATCQEKEEQAFLRLAIDNPAGSEFALVRQVTIPGAPRQSYWFVAVSNCGHQELQLSRYNITFRQGDGSHFSTDEQGILVVYSVYFVFFSILSSVHLYAMYVLAQSTPVHWLFRIFSLALLSEFLGVILHLVAEGIYMRNGIGVPIMASIGDFVLVISQVSFLGLLLLIAKGWTITNNKISAKGVFFVMFVSYATLYLLLFVYQVSLNDPASVKSDYQSVPGIILLVLRCLAFVYFLTCLRTTYKEEAQTSKRAFYRRLGIFFSVWFLIFPISMVVIASVDSTVRDKTVVALTTTITALSMGVMAYLLWPSRTYKYLKMDRFDSPSTNDAASDGLPYGSI